MPVCKGIKHF